MSSVQVLCCGQDLNICFSFSPLSPENPTQMHFTRVNAKIHFIAPVEDPISILNDTIQRGMLGEVPVMKNSLKVHEQIGMIHLDSIL